MCDILNVSAHKKNFLLQEPGPAVVQPAPVAVPQPEPQSTWSLKSRFQHDFHPKKLGKVNPFWRKGFNQIISTRYGAGFAAPAGPGGTDDGSLSQDPGIIIVF